MTDTNQKVRETPSAPAGMLPLRINERAPSVILCANGDRIGISWRDQNIDKAHGEECARAEQAAAYLVAISTLASAPPPAVPDAVGVREAMDRYNAVWQGWPEAIDAGNVAAVREAAMTAALSSIEPTLSPEQEAADAYGWLYHSPDTGTEWAPNHPIESGEVHDAEDVRAATAVTLQAELVSAWRALSEEQDLRRSHIVSSPEVEVSNAETVNTVVNFNELDDLFSRIPSGPYRAIHSEGGWEIRQIDTDPLKKHHWPFRLCQSISGQMAVCDGATFEFIAAILNIWPTFRAALSTIEPTPSPEPQASNAGAVEALRSCIEVIDDYLAYRHDGDPWSEDARLMGEMEINHFARDGGLERARAALSTPETQTGERDGEVVAWLWRYYGGATTRPWYVRQEPIASKEPQAGSCGTEVEPLVRQSALLAERTAREAAERRLAEVEERALAVLEDWDQRVTDGPEKLVEWQYKPYWSPVASMVSSEAMAALRAALRAKPEAQAIVGKESDHG